MKTIKDKLQEMNSSTPKAIDGLLSLGMNQTFKKGSVISNQQHSHPVLYFIEEGFVRGYIEQAGKEQTFWLSNQGFILPSHGFFTQLVRVEYIEFLTYSKVWSVNLSKASVWSAEDSILYRMLLEIYEICLMESFDREFMLRIPNAQLRYQHFKMTHPYLIYSLSKEITASYLSISPKHYSRIKGEDTRHY